MADCSNSGLINIPNSLPKHTDWLILSGNNLTSLNVSGKQTVEISRCERISTCWLVLVVLILWFSVLLKLM